MTLISLVIPCYNEEDAIPVLLVRVAPIMEATGHGFEIGSTTAGLHESGCSAFKAYPLVTRGSLFMPDLKNSKFVASRRSIAISRYFCTAIKQRCAGQ